MAGLTNQGLTIKRLTEVISSLKTEAVPIFQDLLTDPNDAVDTSDSSTIGRLIGLISPSLADLWEATEEVYSAFDPNSATGIALDNLVAYAGISRYRTSPSEVTGLFQGTTNTVIPQGSIVSSSTGNQFSVFSSITLSPTLANGIDIEVQSVGNLTVYSLTYTQGIGIGSNISYTSDPSATELEILQGLQSVIVNDHPLLTATITGSTLIVNRADVFELSSFSTSDNLIITKVRKTGKLECTVNGPIAQEANTLINIMTPVLGWESVTNPLSATLGTNLETDSELRERFRISKSERANSIFEALYSALSAVQDINFYVIYENDTSSTDANGLPPHSFLVIADGGLESEIANKIWTNKPTGIYSGGNTPVSILDSNGFEHTIRFSRPGSVNVAIQLDITKFTNYPSNGDEKIREAIVNYISTLKIGEPLIYSRLYTPINSVVGHQVNSLLISKNGGPFGVSNIPVNFDEIIKIDPINIVIN